ncbi:Rieske 2Fe-2S domain-containing protein [Parahaliea maris]|uniref:Rieske 2Fe-2S domain-containing protein n=1 Tax=Parahaliea maris TaxID=2716870 RepID=A0A5C9A3V1_9GAMM|nr:Rieske 2Fe-2S domain-containing protein [Parahaliea maris]TXS95448.1 Rieske 2Fe-2S domain-containing protein [Parahaliea maris]
MTSPKYAFLQAGHYARGWHIVLFSSELAPGEVKRLHYFDREFVAWRGESGQPCILDAYCPHLGANLASDGGRIHGDNIACPFHGWEFNGTGECVAIPYAKKIPERAKHALKGWPVMERNGFIALWYCPDDSAPVDYIPTIDDWGAENWGEWQFQRSRIRAQPCDVIENIVDIAHFPHVHGGNVQSFENRFGDYTVTQISKVKRDPEAGMITPPGLDFDLVDVRNQGAGMDADAWGDATYHGPSIMYYYTESRSPEISFRSWWVNYHTPVNDDEVDLCSAVIMSSLTDEPLPEEFTRLYPVTAHAAFGQDVLIWQDKMYREDPILCDGDGPITKLRRWYEQFYLPVG